MKALSMYVWSLVVIMMMGFTSCGDDDELQFSEEQLAYINKNKEYIWEKKAEKDENGELKYKQVVIGGDTALYRIIQKENEWTTTPSATRYLLYSSPPNEHSAAANKEDIGLREVLYSTGRTFYSV